MRVGIALGSNLGDRAANLQNAVAAIRAVAQSPILISRVYETAPVNCPPDSDNFLNAAIEIEWIRNIRNLFEILQGIERRLGRPEVRPQNSPRPIDLDLLYAGDLVINDPDLCLPHPRVFERSFVLAPLCDIVPHLQIGNWKQTCREGLDALKRKNDLKMNLSHHVIH